MEIIPSDLVKWFSVALKSKAGEKIGSEISEAVNNEAIALWEKVRPWFIKDDPDLVAAFEEKPEESAPKGALEWKVNGLLEDDETFRSAVIESMKAIEKAKEASLGEGDRIKIVGDHNIVLNANSAPRYVTGIPMSSSSLTLDLIVSVSTHCPFTLAFFTKERRSMIEPMECFLSFPEDSRRWYSR